MTSHGRVHGNTRQWATSGLGPERARKHHPTDESGAQKHVWPFSEMLAPVRGGLDLVLQLPQVRAQAFSSPIDVRLYLVGCFIHSRFSLTDSTVRSGIGCIRLALRMPLMMSAAAAAAITSATISVAAHIDIRVASA